MNNNKVTNISKAYDKAFGMHKENTAIVNELLKGKLPAHVTPSIKGIDPTKPLPTERKK